MPVISVRTLMMRSPLRPEIRAQSSGLVVFGRSSFSLNSSRTDSSMSAIRTPSSPERDRALHRLLLGAVDDVLQHRAAREVLEVEDLALALGVRDLEELVLLVLRVHRLDRLLDDAAHDRLRIRSVLPRRVLAERQVRRQVLGEDLQRAQLLGPVHLDLQIEAAGPQHRGIDQILAVRRADHDHVAQRLDAVDLRQELRDDRRLHVRRDARAAHAEERIHLVEEDHDRNVFLRLLARVLEDLADLVLGLADVLVQELRTLHVQEVALGLAAAQLLDAQRQAVRHRLADHGLAAARRAVEQDALRRRQVVPLEAVGVQVRQLDRVAQHFDLVAEAPDVLVRDVGNFLEHDLVDGRLRQALDAEAGARIHEQIVTGLQLLAPHRLREADHALLVGVTEHDHAAVVEHVGDRHHLAARIEGRRVDDVERLVQHDELTFHQLLDADARVRVHPHHLAVDVDLAGAVLVAALEDAVGVRRRAELVDFLLQQVDLLLRVLQPAHELLVLPLGVERLLALSLEPLAHQLVLHEHALDAAHEIGRLRPEEAQRVSNPLDLVHLVRQPALPFVVITSARYGDALHYVSDEPSSPRTRTRVAHWISSPSAGPRSREVQSTYQAPCADSCVRRRRATLRAIARESSENRDGSRACTRATRPRRDPRRHRRSG